MAVLILIPGAHGFHAPRSMRRGAAAPILALCLLLNGCSAESGHPPLPVDLDAEVAGLQSEQNALAIVNCLKTPLATQDICRDEIVQARLITIDDQYTQFRQAFYGEARWGSFAATITSLGLTSAASLSPLGAAHILGAAATGVTGTQAAYEKQVLIDQTANAIETSMNSGRGLVAVRIRQGLQHSAQDYPLAVALSDLQDYYNAGTLLGALADITKNAGVQAQTADEALETVSGFSSSPPADFLRNYLDPPGATAALLEQRDADARAAEKSIGIATIPGIFASDPNTDPAQLETVAKLLGWNGQ